MSVIADALQPFFVAGLTQVSTSSIAGPLPDLIGRRGKFGYDLDFDNAAKSIRSDFRESSPVVDALAYDISRFSSAAFQSIIAAKIDIGDKDKIPWAFIKSYYAAFYPGHAILRILGSSCSYFDRHHVEYIKILSAAFGLSPTFALRSSAYLCAIDPSGAVVVSTCLRDGGGGAHEAFWQVFGQKLEAINPMILRGPLAASDAQSVFAKLDAMRSKLRAYSSPMHSWLSIIRNEVQYRHEHDLWLPNNILKRDKDQSSRIFEQWTRDPMTIDIDMAQNKKIHEFLITCIFIVALCRELLTRLADRSARPRQSFPTRGPLSLLKNYEAV